MKLSAKTLDFKGLHLTVMDIGLPKPLEAMLHSLLQVQPLSSWQSSSGPRYTQVTLRFNMDDIHMENVSYRKKSPSQTHRDIDRVARWNSQYDYSNPTSHPVASTANKINQSNTKIQSMNVNQQDHHDYSTSLVTESNNTMDTMKHKCRQVGQQSDHESSTGPIAHTTDGAIEAPMVPILAEALQGVNSIDINSAKSDVGDEALGQHEKCMSVGGCDVCGTDIEAYAKWMRCTECDEFDICGECWEKGKHHHHADQVHVYDSAPVYADELQLACMSCRYLFDHANPAFKVWLCRECGDYAICKRCKEQNMHTKHDDSFKYILLSQYFDFIS